MANILTVGVDKQFTTISAAVAASQDGDTVLVDAGTYTNDFAHINTDITLRAVGGAVDMVCTTLIPNGKAILVTDGNTTIDGFSFSGAIVNDQNGAGIRYQSRNLTLSNCHFHHNQTGLLAASDPTGNIVIDNCEFAYNGDGSGSTHGVYVNGINRLTVTDSYFHDTVVGHEIKSRAANTTILSSRIQGQAGSTSYEIDIPNGGNVLIQGNVIQQGAATQNPTIIAIGEEGNIYANTAINIDGNVIINSNTSASDRAVWNATGVTAQLTKNAFFGLTASQIVSGPNVQTKSTFLTIEPVLDTSPMCFLSGTMIACPDGERAVETLDVGDLVLTFDGRAVPVRWIGAQTLSPVFGVAEGRWPVCITAGALGNDLPVRDLRLTADHALLIDNVLVQAGALVNNTTVRRISPSKLGKHFVVFHIETENHEVVLAEGAPAETFIDNVSRRHFDNYAEFKSLYGDETSIVELDQPRAMSARQVPREIRERLAVVARHLSSVVETAA